MRSLTSRVLGVAVARSDKTGYYYAVQMFGRPKSLAVRFTIANDSDAAAEYRLGEQTFTLSPRYTRTHTRCRPPEVTFQFSGEKERPLKPADGDQFVVTGRDGNYQVKKQ